MNSDIVVVLICLALIAGGISYFVMVRKNFIVRHFSVFNPFTKRGYVGIPGERTEDAVQMT